MTLQQSQGEQIDPKKPRRSDRHQSPAESLKNDQLPTPLTNKASNATDERGTVTPPSQKNSDQSTRNLRSPYAVSGLSSPPTDTQPFSQFVYPPNGARPYAVEDEEGEGVWGYLLPVDDASADTFVLRRRTMCPIPGSKIGRTTGTEKVNPKEYKNQEEEYEQAKADGGVVAGGYLIGRHPECGKLQLLRLRLLGC
jgi:serine/threonine-protein kinase Chk2